MRILHNPRCSKSRQTLELIRENGVEPDIILYMENTPNAAELKAIFDMPDLDFDACVRRNETIYKELGFKDNPPDQTTLINAMIEHPKLIERPIVIDGNRAVLGRPPENVLSLFETH